MTAAAGTEKPDASARSRRVKRRWLISALVVVVLAGSGIFAAISFDQGTDNPLSDRTHRPVPSFSLPDLQNPEQSVSLAQFKGKGLVLNFWGSWCGPCRSEMPVLESAYRSEHGRVDFVGIDSDDTRRAAAGFLAKVPVTYELLFDPQEVAAAAFGLHGLPTTVFVSPKGKMLGLYFGQFDTATLQGALREAFGSGDASGQLGMVK